MQYNALHLEPNEAVILEVRKHWIVFFGHIFMSTILAIAPYIVFWLIKNILPGISFIAFIQLKAQLFLFFYSLWVLFLWITFFIDWTNYYLDVWYVTEKRIIIVDQKSLFHRDVSNLRFDKIQDVTLEVKGLISTLLKFSDIRVQTASEFNEEFTMTSVRNPEDVRRIIFSHQNRNSNILNATP